MPIGEFTKYGLVFGSSLIGAVSGYFYSSRAINLRMRMERNGKMLLRSSDPLWMYRRLLKQNKQELLNIKEVAAASQQEPPKTDEEILRKFAKSDSRTEPTDDEAIALLNWCHHKLSTGKYSSTWEKDVAIFCAFPSWSK